MLHCGKLNGKNLIMKWHTLVKVKPGQTVDQDEETADTEVEVS